MKRLSVFLVVAAVLAAPCVTDILSTEPSPLAGLVALATQPG